jgi:hypothetical protein
MGVGRMITISRTINGISINGDEYLVGDDGETPLEFETIKDLVVFLLEHNFTLAEVRELNFNMEVNDGE